MNRDYVTIVSGLPRSGTSLMMQMIHAAGLPAMTDNIRVADDDNPKGYYEFEPVKKTKEDPSWLEQAPGKVVKMVYRLLYDLPGDRKYRVIFMRRQINEILASQAKMLERLQKKGGNASDDQLRKLFESELQKAEKWIAEQANFQVLYLWYGELVKDPAPAVEAINKFLGGDLNTEAMLQTVDPSLYRQRR
jgi:hypothetical protein